MYGIAEIADVLGIGRQLVAAWRRRGSHGMPEPDAELASGPIWLGGSIEPWIDSLPARPSSAVPPVTDAEIRRLARRLLRLLTLLLEERPRHQLVTRAIAEARELLDLAPEAATARTGRAGPDQEAERDDARRSIAVLLEPVRRVRLQPTGDDLAELRTGLVAVLPNLVELLDRTVHIGDSQAASG